MNERRFNNRDGYIALTAHTFSSNDRDSGGRRYAGDNSGRYNSRRNYRNEYPTNRGYRGYRNNYRDNSSSDDSFDE